MEEKLEESPAIGTPPDEFGSAFSINMVNSIPYKVNEVKNYSTDGELAGFMVLDSACQRTCCGTLWYRRHQDLLGDYGLKTKEIDSYDLFQFGKGDPTKSTTRAYIPSYLNNVPLVIGAGVLPERVPLLGSNSLLDKLGSVIDLPNRAVHFTALHCSVELHVKCGHFAVFILDTNHEHPGHELVWKQLSSPSCWGRPHPELVLPPPKPMTDEAKAHGVLNSRPPLPHADSTSAMAGEMEADRVGSRRVPEEHLDLHDGGRAAGHDAARLAPIGSSADPESSPRPGLLRAQGHQEVRQRPWPLCEMQSVPEKMEMEHQEGGLGHLVFPEWDIWYSRGDGSPSSSSAPLPLPQPSSKATPPLGASPKKIKPKFKAAPAALQRQARIRDYERTDPTSVPDLGAGVSSASRTYDGGRAHLPQRGDLPAAAGEAGDVGGSQTPRATGRDGSSSRGGRRDHGLGSGGRRAQPHGPGPQPVGTGSMKSGHAKRLKGEWKKAAQVLEMEYKVNNSGASVRDRPPPHVDLWELFAGSCNLSRLAPHYDLNTLQPLDILFGQDFKNGSMRKKIKAQVDQFKPWLIVMGVDCRFWNLFNINLNWSHRQELLESLQDEERILVQFAVDIALMQYKAGRYFLLENPLRSRLWEEDNVCQLRDLEGIWSTVLDAGAYGAEINNEPIAKPMRWMGNLPGFDQTLNLRLTPTQRLYCKPIQGSMTRRSQQYPDELCHCILQELKPLVFQREPHRFGAPLHQVYAMAYPTEDLGLWDHIVDYITNVYERGAKRPFNIGLDTEMGKTIQQLFRIKAVRLQACYAPTARRIPPNVDEYYTRAALLQYADGTRAVDIEDLGEIEFPKMKFSKAVRVAVFGYGHRLETPDPKQNELKEDRPVIPGMSADISFPNVSDVEQHIRRSVARLHLNLGHPTAPELLRLLAHQGKVPGPVIKAVQGLVCSTCERLRPPQEPRPASMPSLTAGQFADEAQADIFYARLLDGTSFAVLGIVDKATGFHQAGYMPDRNATTAFQVLSDIWLRPFGLPLRFVCDPDHTFRGQFEQRLMAMGVMVEHCPPEAHYIIGMVERRNAILRLTLEKVIDQLGVVSLDQVPTVLIQACHSINSLPFTRGRSGYQAVFGRTPRLPDDVLTDTQVLSTSTQPFRDVDNPGLRAELVRSEAMKALIDLNAQQQFRRALLRKTRNVKVPELLPGQRCAVWRWTKKGVRKRGAWLTARFLSWDPQYPGRQAWVRLGASTTLVTSEQLRAAHGFEDWCPDEQDLKALKDASKDFGPQMLEDERGEPPPESALTQGAELEETVDYSAAPPPPTPTMAVPATPAAAAPLTPAAASRDPTTIHVRIDSPTHMHQHTTVQTLHQRFGDLPKSLSTTRSRRPAQPLESALSKRTRATLAETSHSTAAPALSALGNVGPTPPRSMSHPSDPTILEDPPQDQESLQNIAEQQAAAALLPVPEDHELDMHLEEYTPSIPDVPDTTEQFEPDEQATATEPAAAAEQAAATAGQTAAAEDTGQTTEHTEPGPMQEEDPLPVLPLKRPFDTLFIMEENGTLARAEHHWGGTPPMAYGTTSKAFFKVYATTKQRQQDINGTDKAAAESDTTVDSDSGDSNTEQAEWPKHHNPGMSRQDRKQLDMEIPWRHILTMPPAYIDKFLAAIDKETNSWSEWRSVKPLSREEAQAVLRDKILSKRVLRSRACYRDKNVGQGEVKAKCRIVCLGHQDPDLEVLNRSSPTPGRTSETVMYAMIVAGMNQELFDTQKPWLAWAGDAQTAFLQGKQKDSERPLPLYMRLPKDGLIEKTGHWRSDLYQILGNVYGLSNAPHLWSEEVTSRLTSKGYGRHGFDPQLFIKRDPKSGYPVSMLIVYVDDFLGLHRADYEIAEIQDLFRWGDLQSFKAGQAIKFKGKELVIEQLSNGRHRMKITMQGFLDALDVGKIAKGRSSQDPVMTPMEQKEYRSVSACLQWAATQCRPEISPLISLSNQGAQTTYQGLKDLYEGLDYLKSTSDQGLTIQDIPFTKDSLVLGYSDASWCNASRSGSQIGLVIGITSMEAKQKPVKFTPLDWRSSRAPRVCRSTLAAEACAADEAADRGAYLNRIISELIYAQPSHRVGCRMPYAQATDARSLYDAIMAEAPNISDKRSLVSVRSVQEVVDTHQLHWVPTTLQFADGLTKADVNLRNVRRAWFEDPRAVLADHPENQKLLEQLGAKVNKTKTSEKLAP